MSGSPESCLMKPKVPLPLCERIVPVSLPPGAGCWSLIRLGTAAAAAAATSGPGALLRRSSYVMRSIRSHVNPDTLCMKSSSVISPGGPGRATAAIRALGALDEREDERGSFSTTKFSALGRPVFGSSMTSKLTRVPTGGIGGNTNISGSSLSCLMKPNFPLADRISPVPREPTWRGLPSLASASAPPANSPSPSRRIVSPSPCKPSSASNGSSAPAGAPSSSPAGCTSSARGLPVLASVTTRNESRVPTGGICLPQ
mmetsp:Transcript_12729/g.36631  ORF Transcript_12729/g.36631 Transcript_12729/m.36631 type:complete len:257 (-) Transcript_12729:30-800(-)